MNCDVGKATEGCRMNCDVGEVKQSSFSNLSVTSPTSQTILQPFRRFTYVTAHSPTHPLLHLRHSSFSNPSFASPTSQDLHSIHLASRPWWNIPTTVDQVLDGRIIQTHVKIDALCEQCRPPEQHPGKKSGHMLQLLCQQEPLGTVCLQQDLDHLCLWPGYHDTSKHGYSGTVKESTGEWNGALLSSLVRVSSICIRVMYLHVYGIDLVSVIFRSAAFAQDIQASPQLHGFGAVSYNSRSPWAARQVN